MWAQAAGCFLLPEPMHSAIEPLTPGAPALPFGVGCTATLLATLDFDGSVAPPYMYVQFSANAAVPWENALRTSSSSDSMELGSVSLSSSVFFIHWRACSPPPLSKATDFPSAD